MTQAMPTAINLVAPSMSLRATVEQSLSAAIISGELPPGELVSVPSLAARFGISATPVREAILDLEKRGFVESVRNKGFRVTAVSEQDIREIVQIRQWLECGAVEEIVKNFDKSAVDEFRTLADEIVESAETEDLAAHVATDIAFHLALLRYVGNPRLVAMVADLRQHTRRQGLAGVDVESLRRGAKEHHEMLDMILSGRAAELEELMHRHIGMILR